MMHGEIFHTDDTWPQHEQPMICSLCSELAQPLSVYCASCGRKRQKGFQQPRPIGPKVQTISEGNSMNDDERREFRAKLIAIVKSILVLLATSYIGANVAKYFNADVAEVLAISVVGIGYAVAEYLKTAVTQKRINKVDAKVEIVDSKAEQAATTIDGLKSVE